MKNKPDEGIQTIIDHVVRLKLNEIARVLNEIAGHVRRVPVSSWKRGPAAERYFHSGRTEKTVVLSEEGFDLFFL